MAGLTGAKSMVCHHQCSKFALVGKREYLRGSQGITRNSRCRRPIVPARHQHQTNLYNTETENAKKIYFLFLEGGGEWAKAVLG